MITPVLLLAVGLTGQAAPAPGELASRVFQRYYQANGLEAVVVMTQSMGENRLVVTSELAYQRPSSLRIRQAVTEPQTGRQTLVVSNGAGFSYDLPPLDADRGRHSQRAVEPVRQTNGVALICGEIFAVARPGMIDRSADALKLLVAWRDDLSALREQWVNIRLSGTDQIGKTPVYKLTGQWRAYLGTEITGTYELYVTEDGQLIRYARREPAADPVSNTTVDILTVYDIKDEKLNPTFTADRFALPTG